MTGRKHLNYLGGHVIPFLLAALALPFGRGVIAAPATPASGAVVVFSADTEGHAGPCAECPGHAGLGGLARRASALAKLCARGPVLLLDAGNALYGPDSFGGNGAVIVRAYNALGYDAVNVTPRDFRLGKEALAGAMKGAAFAAVSANVLDADGGRPIARPFVVKEVGGRRVAVLGVSEPPPGMDYLPHLKRQLAGVRITPPGDALREWLPKAKAESDEVVVLYYGSAAGARGIADAFGKDLVAVVAGGCRPEEVAPSDGVPVFATQQHGRGLGVAKLGAAAGAARDAAAQVDIDDSLQADPKMAELVAETSGPAAGSSIQAAPGADADGGAGAGAPAATRADAGAKPDAGASADGGAVADTGVDAAPRRLVPLKVEPLKPAEAQAADTSAGQSAQEPTPPAEPAIPAEAPAPALAPAPASAPPASGGSGVLDFLKSLVNGPRGATAAPAPGRAEPPAEPAETETTDEALPPPPAPPKPTRRAAPKGPATPEPAPAVRSGGSTAPAATGPKFCTQCGAKLATAARFCTACGTRVRR